MPVSPINFTTSRVRMLSAGVEIGLASSFFFRHQGIKYLVTNRHVVTNEGTGTHLMFWS